MIYNINFTLEKNLSAAERGTLLLNVEEYLRANVNDGIRVWLEPMGDKNTLRLLRGIPMKEM